MIGVPVIPNKGFINSPAEVDQMLKLSEDSLSPRKYVALFVVPKESSEFTLLVKNPSMKEGQSRIASVALVK
jgi:hypothetical protein